MEIQDYSEKSIVVFGDKTKEYKDGLRELGGKFNMRLSVGPGWIFPKTERERVEKFVADGVVEKKAYIAPKKSYTTREVVENVMMNDGMDGVSLVRMVNEKIDRLLGEIEGLKDLKKKLSEMKFEDKKEEDKVVKKTTKTTTKAVTKSISALKKKIESSSSEEEDIYFEDELDDEDEKPVKRLL